MPNRDCTVCALQPKPRKLIEKLVIAGLTTIEAVEFGEWWGIKNETPSKVSKSSLDRHKQNGHFVMTGPGTKIELDGEVLNLREYAKRLFEVYQKANKEKIPSTKEMIDFMLADAKLADIESRRNDESALRELLQGASFTKKAPEVKPVANQEEPSSS